MAEQTHIRSDYVRALEEEDFARLPSAGVYVKSYLKSLSRQYQLSPEQIIGAYQEATGGPRQKPITANNRVAAPSTTDDAEDEGQPLLSRRHLRILAGSMAAMILIVLGIVGVGMVKERMATNRPPAITMAEVEALLPPATLPLTELPLPQDPN